MPALDHSNPRLQLQIRQPTCDLCKLGPLAADERDVCITARGSANASVMVVTKNPISEKGLKELTTYFERAGIDPATVAYTAASKCRVWDVEPSKTDLKACRTYLDQEIQAIQPDFILALGNEAMYSAVGKSGILKHRGHIYEHRLGPKVMPTIAPAMIYRNPGLKGGFEADLKYFYRLTQGTDADDGFSYRSAMTLDDLREMIEAIKTAEVMAFDVETNGFLEFASDAALVSISVTLSGNNPKSAVTTWAVPLMHPESPWRRQWRKVIAKLIPHLDAVPKAVAHNGKFDLRWLRQFGSKKTLTFDTMLAAHTLDENRVKGLKPLAQQLLGAKPWGVDTKDLLEMPIEEVLEYNARDTFYTHGLYRVFKAQLGKPENVRKLRIFKLIMMPCSDIFVDVEREGVWVDVPQLMTNWQIAQGELKAIDDKLMSFVPEDHGFKAINFNPSNFARWFIFEHLELPILARGKTKENGDPGAPSMAEAIMLDLRDRYPHPALDLLIERTKWQKYDSAFFSAYAEQVDDNDRIHTNFKLTGTVTGRLSSGKTDSDKVTSRKQNRGVNLQQVPRDNFVRGIFGAPPGSFFVEADYSQVELRVAAFLAREKTMLHLYATNQDIHTWMACQMTGKPASEVTKEERKKAKAVNFGFLYGMGVMKFISTAWGNYGVRVSQEESAAFRKAFFTQFPELLRWHARQRSIVAKYKRVESPLGRSRHLPDIDSPNKEVRAEAERQAINSPVQSFASDMCLLSMVRITNEFRARGMRAHPIGTVHDAINWEIPEDELRTALPLIKDGMENLPLDRQFGVYLDVPIVADLKVGKRWGGAMEVTPDMVYDWKGLPDDALSG